jgi:regulator of protease activity HflC (stomatin/prohibitin superfamily)
MYENENPIQSLKRNRGLFNLVRGAVLAVLVLILIVATIETVGAGSVKEVLRFGRPTGRTLQPGIHLVAPFADSTVRLNTKRLVYETTSEEKQKGSQADYKDYPVDTNTSDGQQVDIYYTVRFSVDPTKTTWIVSNIGDEAALVEKVVKTDSRIWARNIPREYSATELYTGNVQEIQSKIEDVLRPKFADNGILLDSVGIREIKFTEQYVNAIEAKQIAAVEVETAKNRAEQSKHEKERRITEAEGQAEEQRLQRETISDQLLEKLWIEKWNGILPTYMMGDSQALIQIP